ncbi:hypothetical protein BST83_13280 [Polaribacter filamentus]|uniref:Uncharacterized protein n=1 Tax=Polaribacter filamentus TaxID=53483 RepID=A0A2S7KZJ3_9FLAO|nr:hypothetical protein [Polaribacter filamentus]PQB08016.1 hypothetical protein BST83_13280 [Polaribacter filamentus]
MAKHTIKVEEIGGAILEASGGFSHIDILIARFSDFATIQDVPGIEGDGVLATSAIEAATIAGDHAFTVGFGFARITAIQDKNGLESPLIGDAKVHENKLNVIVKGSDAAVIGALRLYKNERLIVLAREAGSGSYRQLGHSKYAAEIIEANAKVAPEYEGENTTMFVIRDKNHVAAPFYTGTITMQPTA